ncbi:uncharacterized protein DFL_009159 [Arthrobotrys flagrans]|uniref:Uncharacterized protein n=1 Tax=Arthrobotrys flagrans TaxID=97331 RepID=A0A436ZQU7_ARTFL|nr:hypothetical protein DFL_009159 [Arthrobotrys flagrans]
MPGVPIFKYKVKSKIYGDTRLSEATPSGIHMSIACTLQPNQKGFTSHKAAQEGVKGVSVSAYQFIFQDFL